MNKTGTIQDFTMNFSKVNGIEVKMYPNEPIEHFVDFIKKELDYRWIKDIPELCRDTEGQYYQTEEFLFGVNEYMDIYDWGDYTIKSLSSIMYKEDSTKDEVKLFTVYRVPTSEIENTDGTMATMTECGDTNIFEVSYVKTSECVNVGCSYALPVPYMKFKWNVNKAYEYDVLDINLVRYLTVYAIEHNLNMTYTYVKDEE